MTRLFYEKMLSDRFPDLPWIRVFTSAPFTVTVYACDKNLDLSNDSISQIKNFLSEKGMATCRHIVKHYFELKNDEAFPIGQVPPHIIHEALKGDVTFSGVKSALKMAFPSINPENIEIENNEVTFHTLNDTNWTPYQRQFVVLMLSEILPVGSVAKLACDKS